MRISARLPRQIKGFRYVKNHHFVELEDEAGNVARLHAKALLKIACVGPPGGSPCGVVFYSEEGTRLGVPPQCLHCGGDLRVEWGSGQLAFVPEAESSFSPPAPGGTGDLEADLVEEPEE